MVVLRAVLEVAADGDGEFENGEMRTRGRGRREEGESGGWQ